MWLFWTFSQWNKTSWTLFSTRTVSTQMFMHTYTGHSWKWKRNPQNTNAHTLPQGSRTNLFLLFILNLESRLLIHLDPVQLFYVTIYLPRSFILFFLLVLIHSSPYLGFNYIPWGWFKIAILRENPVPLLNGDNTVVTSFVDTEH